MPVYTVDPSGIIIRNAIVEGVVVAGFIAVGVAGGLLIGKLVYNFIERKRQKELDAVYAYINNNFKKKED